MTLQEYNDLYKLPCLKKISIVSGSQTNLENENIVSEKMSLTKSLCSDSNLRYGRCEAACFKIRVATDNPDYTGKLIYVNQELVTDIEGYLLAQNGTYLLTEDGKRIKLKDIEESDLIGAARIGQFTVYSDKPTNDRMWRDLTCYDAMYEILNKDVSAWYNSLTFPMTLETFRESFFRYAVNKPSRSKTLVNDDLVIQKGFIVDGKLSGKTVIEAICELNGVFGIIDNYGFFDYVSLADAEELTLDYYQDGTGSYEDYETDAITGIRAIGSNNDAGTTVGTTTNLYVIENNPLIYGLEGTQDLEDALENLLDQIENDSFRPFKVTTYGNPMLPLGTKVTINTRNETVVSYVISKEMTGIQSLKDTIEAKSEKSQPKNINSVANEIKRTKGMIVLKIDANGKIVQAALSADPETGTEFKVEADNISFIANDTIDLAAANLTIEADNFYINPDGSFGSTDGTNPTFSVDSNGNTYVKGTIDTTGGSIGGLEIDTTGIFYQASASSFSGISSTVWPIFANASSKTNLATGRFRVNSIGGLFASGLNLTGDSGDVTDISDRYLISMQSYLGSGGSTFRMYDSSGNSEFSVNSSTVSVSGDLYVYGTKNRIVKTKNYGERLLYCYETPAPMFGDIGEGKIAEDGKCYVWLDSTFSETIKTESYQVFLQKYGHGECYVTERTPRYFVVEGDVGMSFGWEVKARQIGFENERLESFIEQEEPKESYNYPLEAIRHLEAIHNEREVA